MQHMQRIPHLRHMQLGEISPGSAHGIEGAPFEVLEDLGLGEAFVDDLLRLLDRAAGEVDQPERSQRQGHAVAQLAILDVDELERAAAQVSGKTIRTRNASADAKRGIARLFLSRKNADVGAQSLLGLGDELLAIRSLAGRSGRHRIDMLGADLPGQRAETLQSRDGADHPLFRQLALGGHAPA